MKRNSFLIVLLSFGLMGPMYASEPLAPLFKNCYKSEQTSFKMSLGPISTSFIKMFSKELRGMGISGISIAVYDDAVEAMAKSDALKKLKKQTSFSDFPLLTLVKDEDTVVKVFGKEEGGFIKNMYLTIFDDKDKDIVLLHLKGKISLEDISKITTSTQKKHGN